MTHRSRSLHSTRRTVWPWVVLVVLVCCALAFFVAPAVFAGLRSAGESGGIARPTGSSWPVERTPAEALAALRELPERDGRSVTRYDRDQFGQRWLDVDRNGCDTRNDILGRDLDDVVVKPGTNGCKVLSGALVDPYTGEQVVFVSGPETSPLVQIDHVVPLAWAWRQGAEAWTIEQRADFANDPGNLLAVDGNVNQQKAASGPAEWMPPLDAARCDYAITWVGVLDEWQLGVDDADRSALERALAGC